jgi:YhcH/YjgK/YiaL family protein
MVQSYQTKSISEPVELEGHKKYIDIQIVVSGHELIGWMHTANAQVTTPYDEKKDAWLGNVPVEKLNLFRLSAMQVAILYPSDAHAPQLADGKPGPVKKIVIKIAI